MDAVTIADGIMCVRYGKSQSKTGGLKIIKLVRAHLWYKIVKSSQFEQVNTLQNRPNAVNSILSNRYGLRVECLSNCDDWLEQSMTQNFC